MKKTTPILVILMMSALAGYLSTMLKFPNKNELTPEQATATAIIAAKSTQAAEMTLETMTPIPTDKYSTPILLWTPGPYEIVAADTGNSYTIGITSRLSIILDRMEYPPADLILDCSPLGTLGSISNLPIVPPQDYALRYEGIQPGTCEIHDGSFNVTIHVVNQP